MQHHDLPARSLAAAGAPAKGDLTEVEAGPPLMPQPSAVRPICSRCGSDALVRDACAVWSVPAQCWELAGTYDSTTCQACEAESDDLADWRPSGPAGPRPDPLAGAGVAMIYHPGTGTLIAADEAVVVHLQSSPEDDAEEIAARLHDAGASTPIELGCCGGRASPH